MNTRLLLPLVLALPLVLTGCGKPEAPKARAAHAGEADHEKGPEGHAESERTIELSDAQIHASGIALLKAGPAQIRQTLALYGTIAPNAERMREVTARYPGVVRTVTKRVGDSVREGETLATVESNESLRTYSVTAPLSGVVTHRKANPGEYSGDTVMFTVADLSTVWVELSIFPRDVSKVRVGQSVRVQSPDSGVSGEGQVIYVAPFGQTANQTLTARVLLDNADRRWAPGLYVTAEATLAEADAPLAIRNEAVQTLENRSVVFVKGEHGFTATPVTLGRNDSTFAEVTSGMQVGNTYAATNSFILKAELGKGEAEHEH